mmetsp:Transcript_34843/g.51017  ORF Transcript_34843/g.51017 Transcript_34843/m.51017 type:complete len:229 (-) Transcript_34843:144-830(-)
MTAPMSFPPQMQVVLGERLAGPPTVINVAQHIADKNHFSTRIIPGGTRHLSTSRPLTVPTYFTQDGSPRTIKLEYFQLQTPPPTNLARSVTSVWGRVETLPSLTHDASVQCTGLGGAYLTTPLNTLKRQGCSPSSREALMLRCNQILDGNFLGQKDILPRSGPWGHRLVDPYSKSALTRGQRSRPSQSMGTFAGNKSTNPDAWRLPYTAGGFNRPRPLAYLQPFLLPK